MLEYATKMSRSGGGSFARGKFHTCSYFHLAGVLELLFNFVLQFFHTDQIHRKSPSEATDIFFMCARMPAYVQIFSALDWQLVALVQYIMRHQDSARWLSTPVVWPSTTHKMHLGGSGDDWAPSRHFFSRH